MSNSEIIEWLKKKAEAVPMPGARKMYEAAAKAIEAQNVAEKALDEYEYKGKTLRQWIEIISATKDGTNLAEVGTDCINRQAAIDELDKGAWGVEWDKALAKAMIESLPPAHPEIVRCKDCKYAEYIDDVKTLWCTECGQGRTVAPNDFCSYAERRTDG